MQTEVVNTVIEYKIVSEIVLISQSFPSTELKSPTPRWIRRRVRKIYLCSGKN
jgi:hypothetical protein